MKTNFFNTPFGSYLKHFLTALIMFFVTNGFSFEFTLIQDIAMLVVPTLPMLLKVISGAEGTFWNTWYGGLVKSVLTLTIAFIIAKGGFVGWTFKELIQAILPSLLPVIFNAVNPADTRYGIKKD